MYLFCQTADDTNASAADGQPSSVKVVGKNVGDELAESNIFRDEDGPELGVRDNDEAAPVLTSDRRSSTLFTSVGAGAVVPPRTGYEHASFSDAGKVEFRLGEPDDLQFADAIAWLREHESDESLQVADWDAPAKVRIKEASILSAKLKPVEEGRVEISSIPSAYTAKLDARVLLRFIEAGGNIFDTRHCHDGDYHILHFDPDFGGTQGARPLIVHQLECLPEPPDLDLIRGPMFFCAYGLRRGQGVCESGA